MYKVQQVGDVSKVTGPSGDFLHRVGDLIACQSGAVLYESVGCIKRFSQRGPSRSLRVDRVRIKKMLEIAA